MTDTDSGKRLSDAEIAEMRAFAKSLDGNYWINIDKDRLLKNHLALLSHIASLTPTSGGLEERARELLAQTLERAAPPHPITAKEVRTGKFDNEWDVKIGDAIAAVSQALSQSPPHACCEGMRDRVIESVKFRLREHWITGVHCDHERKTDRASCSCTVWRGEEKPSIDAAVQDWIEHAMPLFATASCRDDMREALKASRSFVEMAYDENGGEEAADAKHVLDQIDAALKSKQPSDTPEAFGVQPRSHRLSQQPYDKEGGE